MCDDRRSLQQYFSYCKGASWCRADKLNNHSVTLDFLSGCHKNRRFLLLVINYLFIYTFILLFFLELTYRICKTIRNCTSSATMRHLICIASTYLKCCTLPRHCCLICIASKWQIIGLLNNFCIICWTRWYFLYLRIKTVLLQRWKIQSNSWCKLSVTVQVSQRCC